MFVLLTNDNKTKNKLALYTDAPTYIQKILEIQIDNIAKCYKYKQEHLTATNK